jgi:hypothetical protein
VPIIALSLSNEQNAQMPQPIAAAAIIRPIKIPIIFNTPFN